MKQGRWVLRKRIKYILLTSIFTLTFALSVIFGSSLPTYSQVPTSNPRQELILEIQEYAERHVENDSSLKTEHIVNIFKENKAGLTAREISQVYEKEYDRLRKLNQGNKKSPDNTKLWQQLLLTPKKLTWGTIGWGTAIILFFLLIFRNVLENWLTKRINQAGDWLYKKLGGSPLLLRTALKRYQKSLVARYQELKIVYRPNLPLDMAEVYVPLKVAGSRDSEQIEARQAIAEYPRLMVKGLPGSGKSMLLKHLALTYGKQGGFNNSSARPIPVLIELHELTDSALDLEKLEQHLVTVLDRNNFPKAERFISQSLKQGKLLLLFDGLDEVNSNVRRQVVQTIKNLLQKDQYRKCPALITCRTAVYNDEFNDVVEQTLEIVEFNDRQIRLFLKSWESQMPSEKSIDQLLRTLRDKPRIMTLARNPLLLTIIAYLYCDTAFVLPDSRSEFYRKSTDVLLELRDEERGIANQYRANEKRRVLQKLALYNQDNAQAQQQDRRSINYETVLAEIQAVLPSLSLNPHQDTKPILREIVERSGLFIRVDSGDKYQFAHLSIQEFFAAEALTVKWRDFIVRYRKDPDAWRETVKLWCGLAGDSTELIKAIYAEDALLAFECLADAQEVEQDLAARIIDQFKNQLGRSNNEDNLAKAFGAVAASSRARGKAVFEFLREILTLKTEPINRRSAAASALSLTNLPKAAQALAHQYTSSADEIRQTLVKMGDIAVSELKSKANEGYLGALNDLLAIATPNAATALVPFLWQTYHESAILAAWNLAALLRQPDVEERLHKYKYPITLKQKEAGYLEWIWQPFSKPPNSSLSIIAGRIAYLLKKDPRSAISTLEQNLDPRIVIPLCAIEFKGEFENQWNPEWDNLLVQKEQSSKLDKAIRTVVKALLQDKIAYSPHWRFVFSSLAPRLQLDILRRLINYRSLTRVDWRNLYLEVDYEFKNDWHYRLVLVLALAMTILSSAGIIMIMGLQPHNWSNGLLSLAALVEITFWIFLWRGIEEKLEPTTFISFGLFGFLTFWRELYQLFRENIVGTRVWALLGALNGAMVVAVAVALLGALLGVLTMGWTIAMAVTWAWAMGWTVAGAGAVGWALALALAGTGAVGWALALALAGTGAGAATIAGFGVGFGVGAWARAKYKQDFTRFLAIFAYPFFCWSPIVFCFSTFALLEFLSWQYTLLVWLTVLGVGTALWMRGQKLEEQARNPLKGILDQP